MEQLTQDGELQPESQPSVQHCKPLSILLITYSYPPVLGGSEVEAQRVSATLIRRGHKVQVLCAGGAPMPALKEWVDPEGVPVTLFGASSAGRMRDIAFAAGVVSTIVRGRQTYDVVYFLMQGLHLAAALPIVRLLKLPTVMKFSGSRVIPFMMTTPLGRLELRLLNRWADRLMILNEEMIAQATAVGLSTSLLTWMPNPVDTAMFTPLPLDQKRGLRKDLQIQGDAGVILFVGRFIPVKEIPSLFTAFRSVVAKRPNAVLVMLGDGELREDLEVLARELNIRSNIRFEGRVDSAGVVRWLQASDIFSLVSSKEGFSCSLVEAMAAGLPSVVSAIPANTQLIEHGVDGLLAPALDSEALAVNILRLLEDGELRSRLGDAARHKAVNNYSLDRVAERYENLFVDILERRASI